MKFKDFMKAGKFVKMEVGDSKIFILDCDPFSLESRVNRFGQEAVEVRLIDPEDDSKKIFNVKSASVANQLAKFEEGDKIKISKVDSDDGKGRWKISTPGKKSSDVEDEDEEEETPKKKSRDIEVEDEDLPGGRKKKDDDEEDEDEEDEKPKKKKKKSDDEDDDLDF